MSGSHGRSGRPPSVCCSACTRKVRSLRKHTNPNDDRLLRSFARNCCCVRRHKRVFGVRRTLVKSPVLWDGKTVSGRCVIEKGDLFLRSTSECPALPLAGPGMLSVGSIHFLLAPWHLWYGPPKMSALLLCLCRRNARVSSLFHQCRRQIEGR